MDGGQLVPLRPGQGRAQGTTVEVRRLFYNTPARLKFLKADATESSRAQSDLGQLSLAHPAVAFQLRQDGRLALDLTGGSTRRSACASSGAPRWQARPCPWSTARAGVSRWPVG